MSTRFWNRREVLKVASAALIAAHARPANAQQVKWSMGSEAAKLKAPANATDCHHHVYNAKYPVDPKATLRPGDALVEDYRALQKRIGTTRNVLVQPSGGRDDARDDRAALEAHQRHGMAHPDQRAGRQDHGDHADPRACALADRLRSSRAHSAARRCQ